MREDAFQLKLPLDIKLRPRDKGGIMVECVEGGVAGGIHKARKWDLFDCAESNESEMVRLISSYVLANIEEEFDLE